MAVRYTEEDIVMNQLQLLFEFDRTNFINGANKILGKPNVVAQNNITYYTEILRRSINSFSELNLDKEILLQFKSNLPAFMEKIDTSNIPYTPINVDDVKEIKSKNLEKFLAKVGVGMDNPKGMDWLDYNTIKKVKSDIVSSTVTGDTLWLLNANKAKLRPSTGLLTRTQLENEIMPFIASFPKKKITILAESTAVLKEIEEAQHFINFGNEVLAEGPVDKLKINSMRSVIDVVGYVVLMTVHRLENYISYALNISEIYTDLMNTNLVASPTIETTIETMAGVNNETSGAVADKLINGDASVFVTMANHIFELYNGKFTNTLDGEGYSHEFRQGSTRYNRDVYDNIGKAIIAIDQGLGYIAGRLDDYILLETNMINKAGFAMPPEVRFKGSLDAIKDLSEFQTSKLINLQDRIDEPVFLKALEEVKDYPKNMELLADMLSKTKTRLNALEDMVVSDFNGELKNETNMTNLQYWVKEFDEQFKKFANIIAGSFIYRLKELEQVLENASHPAVVTNENFTFDNTDFLSLMIESTYQDFIAEEAFTFDVLMDQLKRSTTNQKLKDAGLLTEADALNANQQANQQNKTTPTVTDNGGAATGAANSNNEAQNSTTNKTAGFVERLSENLDNFFDTLIETYLNMVNKWNNSKYLKAIRENRDALATRSYNNVSITMLPYSAINAQTIQASLDRTVNDIDKAVTGIMKLPNPNEADIYKLLFNLDFTPDPANAKEQFVNYYKTKTTTQPNVVTTANGDLRNLVINELLPYVDNFDAYYKTIQSTLNNAKQKVKDAIKKTDTNPNNANGATAQANANNANAVKPTPQTTGQTTTRESAYELSLRGLLYLEADNQPNEGETRNRDYRAMIMKAVKLYIGSVLNALRDRNNDYFKVLYQLIPKNATNANQQTNQQANQNEVNEKKNS